ncbi:MAG: hypothetical protein JHD13_10070 [Synechococcales cyanobacterium SupBloom_Metag_052]|nr:hypothetical protein [Synechococcales cyanobacterium SupBloom_Metag_052]
MASPASGTPGAFQRLGPLLLLALASLATFNSFGSIPMDGIHPLAVITSLLPVQLAAVLWLVLRRRD